MAESLASYMLRAPFSLEKMTYDTASGAVIYRSRLHATLKRNFQAMPGAEWLELLALEAWLQAFFSKGCTNADAAGL